MAEFGFKRRPVAAERAEGVRQRRAVLRDNRANARAGALVDNRPAQRAPKPNNTGLPDNLKSGIENLSGMSMDSVCVHYNSAKPVQLNAHAYAQGADIHLAPGQEQHLPHEAWHVVQQAQGRVKPTMQMKSGVPVNDDQGLEHEADVMGARAVSHGGVVVAHPLALNPNPSVAQCRLDVSLLKGRTRDNRIKELVQKANQYNNLGKKVKRATRIQRLHDLNVAILQWLDNYEVGDHDTNPGSVGPWVKELLNEVQREHEELVELSIVNNDTEPPVANLNKLDERERAEVKRIWKQLVSGTGNVRITEDEDYEDSITKQPMTRSHPGFRYEILAQFARLLEIETGREIVAQVNKGTKGKRLVTIRPGLFEKTPGAPSTEAGAVAVSGDDSKLEFVDINSMYKNQKGAKAKRKNYSSQFIRLHLQNINDPKERAGEIYRVRKEYPWAKGVIISGKYYKFGSGSAVNVSMPSDIKDSSESTLSRMLDENRNEIPMPNFITLGHELGHAAHMLSGSNLGGELDESSNYLLPMMGVAGRDTLDWSSMEEFGNIHSVENAMRKDLGMKSRYGHGNQPSYQRSLMKEVVVPEFYNLCDALPPAGKKWLDKMIKLAGSEKKAPDYRKGLKIAANKLLGYLNQLFPDFTDDERAAIGNKLTGFEEKILWPFLGATQEAAQLLVDATQLVRQARQRVAQQPQVQPGNGGGGYFGGLKFW